MEEREKRYVPVIVRFEADGKLRPLEIEFDEAHRYPVDKILDVRRAACQSVGGVGDRYTCRIQGKESYSPPPPLSGRKRLHAGSTVRSTCWARK